MAVNEGHRHEGRAHGQDRQEPSGPGLPGIEGAPGRGQGGIVSARRGGDALAENPTLYARILQALEDGPRTLDELCADVGFQSHGRERTAVKSAVHRLLARKQVAHVMDGTVHRYRATGNPGPPTLDREAMARRRARWLSAIPEAGATAREMGEAWGVTQACASCRLQKLRDGGMVTMERIDGHRYVWTPVRGEA